MDWNEITARVPSARIDDAAAIANMTVPYGIYIEDYSDLLEGAREIAHIDLIDEDLLKKDRTQALIHIYLPAEENPAEALSFLRERFKAAGIDYYIDELKIKDEDYVNGWKKYFKKTAVGDRLLICPAWEEAEDTGRAVLKIDPGAAFGTGTHATTSMCLRLLCRYVRPGATVLDIGCGSGILSAAAALLGAQSCTGVDIDETAVKVAEQTAKLNGIEHKCRFFKGDAVRDVTGRFDIIAANIVADVIIGLSGKIEPLLSEDGLFICSGIIEQRGEEVKAALTGCGMTIVEQLKTDNWFAFACRLYRP